MKIRRGIYILPSLFTTGNIFCGFYAFIAVLNNQFYMAAWAIVLAIVFDGLDGRVARFTKTTSKFGVQYDSLADIISFGMAPAFMVYVWKLKPFGRLGWMAAFLFLICGALRLARFNTMKPDADSNYFQGLPIPAAAAIIATIVILSEDQMFVQVPPIFLAVSVYILAFLMVSNLRYPTFKKFGIKKRVPFARFLFVVLALYIFATIPRLALCFISITYVLVGPFGHLISLLKKNPVAEASPNSDNQPEKF
ncbi:MAG: CDP-diacylglycerol--serine O-phosphatidyltransferase [Nitrospinota bacterium]|nr:CDP-diacylglycerol--serine O-phosphatidyltransferase [Nitrospinota bacterium]